MFWSLGHFSSPTIDTILDRESGFTLEELLDEDELLQECKAQNTKLTEFLIEQATLSKLLGYITQMPSDGDSEARCYKYPYVASEILSCDMLAVRDAMFAAPALLTQLLSILEQPAPLPPVLAGYVCKVVAALQKSAPDSFSGYFEHADGLPVKTLLPRLLKHLDSDAILQMLVSLCVGEPAPTEPGMPASAAAPRDDLAASSWLPHSELLPAAFECLSSDQAEVASNASQFLCCLLAASAEPPACLEDGDAGRERCAALVRACLGKTVGGAPNLAALEVLLQLLCKLREATGPAADSPCADFLLAVVEESIERFYAALAAPAPLPARIARFIPTDAATSRPRGQQRCKLLLLLEESMRSGRPGIVLPLLEMGVFDVVIDLLLLPHTCNAVHMRTAAILECAISAAPDRQGSMIHESLLRDSQLPSRLLALVNESGANGEGEGKPKPLPCCHAFVMALGSCLLSAAQREPSVRALLEECDAWSAFVSPGGALTRWEAVQSKPLGGRAPTRADENDSDDDDDFDSSTVERVLAAQAAASRAAALDAHGDGDDDDEGGHSSEYLTHFAEYLSNRNFLNQTSEDIEALSEQLPPPPSEAWTAEFDFEDARPGDFDDLDRSSSPGASDGTEAAAADSSGRGGAEAATDGSGGDESGSGAPSAADDWAAFESLPTPSPASDDGADGGWAAFDTISSDGPPTTGSAAEAAESGEGGGGDRSSTRSSSGDPELSI